MRASLLVIITALVACESGARRELPAAVAPDASASSVPREPPAPGPPVAATLAPSSEAMPPAPPRAVESVPTAALSAGERPCRVAFIGDSLTEGRIGGGYVRYLTERSPKSRFVNFAKGGWMVNQMRRALVELLTDDGGSFTHLVVFGGVNDLYSDETAGRTVAKIEADLSALYAAGRARGFRVVGITVAPWGGFGKYYNERRGAATRDLNAWILAGTSRGELDVAVDAYALLSCGVPDHLCARYALAKSDGLHFGKLGHETLGRALYEAEFRRCP